MPDKKDGGFSASAGEPQNNWVDLIKIIKENHEEKGKPMPIDSEKDRGIDVDEEIKKNESDTNLDLKRQVKRNVFGTLWAELVFIAIIVLLQGFKFREFQIDETTFGLLVSGIIIQTLLIVRYITFHLFPNNKTDNSSNPF